MFGRLLQVCRSKDHSKDINKETVITLFEDWTEDIYRMIHHMSSMDGKAMKHLWWRRPENNINDLCREADELGVKIKPDCYGYWESLAIGTAIVSARFLYTVVDEITSVVSTMSQLRMSVKEAMDKYTKVVADDDIFQTEFKRSTPAKSVFKGLQR